MEDQSFPRFQYSVFTANGGQFVVRSNDFETFKEDIKTILAYKKASDATSEANTPQNDVKTAYNASQSQFCARHNVPLQWSQYPSKKTGKKYLYHKDGDQLCFGR